MSMPATEAEATGVEAQQAMRAFAARAPKRGGYDPESAEGLLRAIGSARRRSDLRHALELVPKGKVLASMLPRLVELCRCAGEEAAAAARGGLQEMEAGVRLEVMETPRYEALLDPVVRAPSGMSWGAWLEAAEREEKGYLKRFGDLLRTCRGK